VLAFADKVKFPADPCYSEGLSLATPANKKKLREGFITGIQPLARKTANYSNAFSEAFRLLAHSNVSESANGHRGT